MLNSRFKWFPFEEYNSTPSSTIANPEHECCCWSAISFINFVESGLVTPSNVLHIFRLGFWVHFIKICQPRMTVDVVSCFILITSDSHTEEQTFIKCEQTNLILVVSKLENLLTKLIFQFYSISPHPSWLFSLYICIIVLSPLRTWFITFTLVWNDISFLRHVINLCVSSH